ncbi:Hypothetical protein PHPALM_20688 [Phytophthora palmivora]|uniref:BRCT domain-containing protein n=1 Tax=Phytophthora palmivora TaxID=4796 RepID=A0A2P4XE87_9STRA|nr:Hypothetical protein PHPALM_20688 [Phytophthora palmivora]
MTITMSPTKPHAEDEPVIEPNSPSRNVDKNSDNPLASKHISGSDSQTKAIRSLEFSFAIPESEEGEPHFSASITSDGTPATKRIEAFSKDDRPSPFEASISPHSIRPVHTFFNPTSPNANKNANPSAITTSRTLFKYKFEFCLTGFVKTGEENLKELIEGHGGKIPERYQDVLYKNNSKAVVIATPVSWRKRKFMQALSILTGSKIALKLGICSRYMAITYLHEAASLAENLFSIPLER